MVCSVVSMVNYGPLPSVRTVLKVTLDSRSQLMISCALIGNSSGRYEGDEEHLISLSDVFILHLNLIVVQAQMRCLILLFVAVVSSLIPRCDADVTSSVTAVRDF